VRKVHPGSENGCLARITSENLKHEFNHLLLLDAAFLEDRQGTHVRPDMISDRVRAGVMSKQLVSGLTVDHDRIIDDGGKIVLLQPLF